MPHRELRSRLGSFIVYLFFLLWVLLPVPGRTSADDGASDSALDDTVCYWDISWPAVEEGQRAPDAHDLFVLASDLWHAGLQFESVATLDSAISLFPSADILWTLRGLFDKDLGNYEYSLLEFDTAIRLAPDDPFYWYSRANALQALDRLSEALVAADSAIARDRNDISYWNKRAFLLKIMDRDRDAVLAVDSAIKYYRDNHRLPSINPEDLNLREGEAIEVWSNEKPQATIGSDGVVSADEATPFWSIRAVSLMNLKRYEEAIESLDSTLAEDRTKAIYWFDRAICLVRLNRLVEASFTLDSAFKYNDDPEKIQMMENIRDLIPELAGDSTGDWRNDK